MYAPYPTRLRSTRGTDEAPIRREYTHSMGNSVGGLRAYTALSVTPPTEAVSSGTADQALYHEGTAGSGGEFLAYGGF